MMVLRLGDGMMLVDAGLLVPELELLGVGLALLGAFKIDQTSVGGAPFDLHSFARYGNEGVLALFSDSTNVERPGFTPSERAIVPRIEELCRSAPRRVILSCFASSIHRIQQVIDIASRVNR